MAAFTAHFPTVLSQLGGAAAGTTAAGTGTNISSRATITIGNKPFLDRNAQQKNLSVTHRRGRSKTDAPIAAAAATLDASSFATQLAWPRNYTGGEVQVAQHTDSSRLPAFLQRLTDPDASADFPPAHRVNLRNLDNRELDKLVAALGRNKSTWRRALQLHEWLLGLGHSPDDRLCTTLMRVCSQHGHALEALNLYDWMRTSKREGGAGLRPTVYTYTGAMRAALVGNLPDRAFKVWEDAMKGGCQVDCRMCTTLIEVCTRKGHTDRALSMYALMRDAEPGSKMAPSVHAYTAAMRAAAEGGLWQRALDIWQDMKTANCSPSGHAYAAAISACATGGAWEEAVKLFDEMMAQGIKPDVVSCTALITALAADGQWEQAESLVDWMLRSGVKPNVRTFTALVTAMGNAAEWSRALLTIERMRHSPELSASVEPNAYTYSALIKTMGEQGQWKMAEELFGALEAAARGDELASAACMARVGQTANEEASSSGVDILESTALQLKKLSVGQRSSSQGSLGSLEFGVMPTALAEEVLKSSSPTFSANLPDTIPGQEDLAPDIRLGSPFSFFSGLATTVSGAEDLNENGNLWTVNNAATSGLHDLQPAEISPRSLATESLGVVADVALTPPAFRLPSNSGILNEVVCGAMMAAYERAGCWQQAVNVIQRSRKLGIEPNTIMYNTAMSALGKGGCWEAAEQLFSAMPEPDTVSYETMIAAYGLAGETAKAEMLFTSMVEAGHIPRDYAFCGLIAAYSSSNDWRSALRVRLRMQSLGLPLSVHVYNALIAVCEHENQWDQALSLHRSMKAEGVTPNQVTHRLLESVGKGGITQVEGQQVAATALAAAVAAAGSLIIRAGLL